MTENHPEALVIEYFNEETLEYETIPFADLPHEVQQGLIDCAHLDSAICSDCGSRRYRATDTEHRRCDDWVCPNCGVIEDAD